MDIREFLEARLAEDAWWARNAGGRFGNTPPETGEHWHWVESRGDTPVTPDPTVGEHLDEAGTGEWRALALRSVEHYPIENAAYELPSFIISTAEEVNTVAAGHITRHDPARVLRDVEAKRRLLHVHAREHACLNLTGRGDTSTVDSRPWELWEEWDTREMDGVCLVLRLLALPYSDHPDYDPSWSPT